MVKSSKKKDFRNMQQTQFDRGQVLKGSFSELNSALRTVDTNTILKDVYTHFTQTLNSNDLPTEVTYYQAIDTAIDEIEFVGDVSLSLAGDYIVLQQFLEQKTHALYYVVDGNGVAPGIADVETPIAISEDDNAATVCFATKAVLDSIDDFIVTSKSPIAGTLNLEYFQFGETLAIDVDSTGFTANRIKEGVSCQVGYVELTYDINDNPIYNGNVLKGLVYNPYTASFDVELKSEVTVTLESTPETFAVTNIAVALAATETAIVIPDNTKRFSIKVQEPNTRMEISDVSAGDTYTIPYGGTYVVDQVKTNGVTLYVTLSRNTRTIQLLTWS